MKKNFLILCRGLFIAAAMMTGFAACSDDDEEIINNDDEEITEWVRPTEDVIQNHIDLKTVVYGNFDEVTERVIARITSPQIGNTTRTEFIPEDAQLVIMDNNTMLDLSKEQIDALYDAYQRGTICYLHKPNAFGAALFYATMEMGSDALLATSKSQTRADDDSWLYPYDVMMMHKEKGLYQLANVYSEEPRTYTTIVEEIDDETNEVVSSTEKKDIRYQLEPNAYDYGQSAEGVAKWINKSIGTKSLQTRSGNRDELEQVPGTMEFTQYFNHQYTSTLTLYYWVSSLYNFDEDQDYYHITMREEYDARNDYKGVYRVDKHTWGAYDTKYMGRAYNGPRIWVGLYDKEHARLRAQWNEQPTPEGKVITEQTVKGWSAGISVGYSNGLVGSLSASYTNSNSVTTTDYEMKFDFQKNANRGEITWEYDYGAKSSMAFKGGTQPLVSKEPDEKALCRYYSAPTQSWSWVFADTKKNNLNELSFCMNLTVPFVYRRGIPTGLKVKQENYIGGSQFVFPIRLPIPNRYMHTYSLMLGTIHSTEEWNSLYPVLQQSSKNFAKFSNHESRCGKSENALEETIAAEWNEIETQLGGLELINLENTYRIKLKDENNRVCGKTLVIDKNSIRME